MLRQANPRAPHGARHQALIQRKIRMTSCHLDDSVVVPKDNPESMVSPAGLINAHQNSTERRDVMRWKQNRRRSPRGARLLVCFYNNILYIFFYKHRKTLQTRILMPEHPFVSFGPLDVT